MEPPVSLLEIFLLFCAKIGLGTTYLISTQTGMGTGANGDVLRKMEKKGLLTFSTGPRGQIFFSLTKEGEMLLLDALDRMPIDWKNATSGVYEGLPRVIFFSWMRGQLDDARSAVEFVEERLMKKARNADFVVEEERKTLNRPQNANPANQKDASPEYLTAVFRFIGAVSQAALLRQKVVALGELRQLIEELPPTPKTFLLNPFGQVADGIGDSESAMPQEK